MFKVPLSIDSHIKSLFIRKCKNPVYVIVPNLCAFIINELAFKIEQDLSPRSSIKCTNNPCSIRIWQDSFAYIHMLIHNNILLSFVIQGYFLSALCALWDVLYEEAILLVPVCSITWRFFPTVCSGLCKSLILNRFVLFFKSCLSLRVFIEWFEWSEREGERRDPPRHYAQHDSGF